jgi:hypothetical protein
MTIIARRWRAQKSTIRTIALFIMPGASAPRQWTTARTHGHVRSFKYLIDKYEASSLTEVVAHRLVTGVRWRGVSSGAAAALDIRVTVEEDAPASAATLDRVVLSKH